MLSWFRSTAPGVAATLLLSLAALGRSFYGPHPADCHDADCGAIFIAHDASAHRVTAAPAAADTHPLHCLVCHWARSFRPRVEVRFLTAPAAQAGFVVHIEYFTASARARAAQPPLRSPPSSPDLA
jgi:hypothetical protein